MTMEPTRLDRPAREEAESAWNAPDRPRPVRTFAEPAAPPPAAPASIAPPTSPGLTPGRVVAWALAGGISLVVLVTCIALLLVLLNLLNAVGGLNSAIGSIGGALGQAGQGIGGIVGGIRNLADPARPPAGGISYDAEFSALADYRAGDVVGRAGEYTFTLVDVHRRDEAGPPETSYYAVIRRAYTTPKETKVLGVTTGVDRGEQDLYLYKGQSYRLGRTFYKVNWVAWDERRIGVATYRDPNAVAGPVVFAYE